MRVGAVVPIALFAVVVAGCTSVSNETSTTDADGTTTVPVVPEPPEAVVADWLPTMSETQSTSMAALIRGELRIDIERRCVTINTGENRSLLLVFWNGAVLDVSDPAEPVLIRANSAVYHDGDMVEFGGGAVPLGSFLSAVQGHQDYAGIEIPDECATDAVWITAADR